MLTCEELKKWLTYDPEEGVFTRLIASSNSPKGSVAGSLNNCGYLTIRVNAVKYFAHRLAWLYMYGEWPKGDIDHINRARADNRICNLREVSASQNLQNTTARSNSRTGVKGVSLHKLSGKYRAAIRTSAGRKHLGLFYTIEEAAAAYNAAAARYHGEFACTSPRPRDQYSGPPPNNPPVPRPEIGTHKSATKRSATGVRGVYAAGEKYRAQIYKDGARIHVGYFPTMELAGAAYNEAAEQLRGGPAVS